MKKYTVYLIGLLAFAAALGSELPEQANRQRQEQANREQERLKVSIQKNVEKERELREKLENIEDALALCEASLKFTKQIEQEQREYASFLREVGEAQDLGAKATLIMARNKAHQAKLGALKKDLKEKQSTITKLKEEIEETESLPQSKRRASWFSRVLAWFKGKQEAGPINEDRLKTLRANIDVLYKSLEEKSVYHTECVSQVNAKIKELKQMKPNFNAVVKLGSVHQI